MVSTRSKKGVSSASASAAPSPKSTAGMTEAKLLVAVSGIFFAFSAFAVLQEDVYRKSHGGERFRATFLVLVVERGVNTLAGAIGVLLLGRGTASGSPAKVRVPVREILVSGVSQMLAMAFSNEALRYVSFATQVLGKSCKMIPVMIGGIAAGRAFPTSQYVQVAVITAGVVVFNLGKPRRGDAGKDSAYGLALIAASLLMDFITATLQDRVKAATRRLNPKNPTARTSMFESMLWTNAGGVVAAAVLASATGHLSEGAAFSRRHPSVARAIAAYALSSVVGQLFIYFTITEFDPLVLSTVTTTRKIFSTVYSVLRNPTNAPTQMQWGGCGAVFAALGWEVLEKYRRTRGAKRMGGKKRA